MAEGLVEAGVEFVDAAGNVHVHWPGKLYVLIKGARPARSIDATPERLFQGRGLQVLFVLLSQPGATNLSYRELAATAGVSLGTISVVMKELKRKRLLEQRGREEWTLAHKGELIDRWVGGYGGRLRPKLLLGRFRAPEGELGRTLQRVKRHLDTRKPTWALTGGFAADALTGHFRGDHLSLFVRDKAVDDLRRELRWIPSREGDITLLRLFSSAVPLERPSVKSNPVAHPLLVYAELVFQGGERELEAAKILYQRELAGIA
jgi:hypothetical protein